MSINRAHQLLGHKSEANTRLTAKALGLTISRGSMEVCEACALAKAKQKGVPKKPDSVNSFPAKWVWAQKFYLSRSYHLHTYAQDILNVHKVERPTF
jgi:hypothetical protein